MSIQKNTTTKKKFLTRSVIVVVTAIMVLATSTAPFQSVSADNYDDQIAQVQAEINAFQSEIARLRSEAQTLQNEIAVISAEKNTIQAEVNLSQAKYDKLIADISANEKKLGEQQEALSVTIGDLSTEANVSPIELLAGSSTVGEYVSRQDYRASIQDQVTSSIHEIKRIKTELAQQKVDVERVLTDQKAQRDALASKEAEQAGLLAQAQGEAAGFQGLVESRNSQIASLRAQQADSYQSYGTGSNSPTGMAISYINLQTQNCYSSGYSYCGYGWDDIVSDPWGLGYTRECVHYAADTLARRGYYIPYNLFAGRGNAYQWTSTASGVATINKTPAVNSVVYMPIGGLGHVGIVEAVYGNGYIKVSQMNLPFGGHYSTMDLKLTDNLTFLHFSR